MMNKSKRKRIMKYKQNQLNQMFAYLLIMNVWIVAFIIGTAVFVGTSGNNQIEDGYYVTVYESTTDENDHNTTTPPANVLTSLNDNVKIEQETDSGDKNIYNRNLSENDKYLLAKIAMAEAEGESLEAKVFVILVVLNRVESKDFPNTIDDVIFQKLNGVYQFTPIGNGRWYDVEPNEECWKAVNIVNTTDYDFSEGALYFEACSGESWHSRNLKFICQVDNTRFYK